MVRLPCLMRGPDLYHCVCRYDAMQPVGRADRHGGRRAAASGSDGAGGSDSDGAAAIVTGGGAAGSG